MKDSNKRIVIRELSRESSIHDLDSAPDLPPGSLLLSSEPQQMPSTQLPSPRPRTTRTPSPSKQKRIVKFSGSDPNMDFSLQDIFEDNPLEDEMQNSSRRGSAPARLAHLMFSLEETSEQPSKPSLLQLTSTRSLKLEEVDEYEDDHARNRFQDTDKENGGLLPAVFGLDFNIRCCANPGYNRVSSFIVRNAPCFWFCGSKNMETGATDRSILYRLNILCSFFAFIQICSAILLLIFFYSTLITERDDESVNRRDAGSSFAPNLWNLNGSIFFIGFLGVVIFITMLMTLKVVREVNLRGGIKYMW